MRYLFLAWMVVAGMLLGAAEVKLPAKEKFYLVLLAGQSNMAGRGVIESQDKVAHPRVLMLNRQGEWVPAVDPVHYDKSAAGVGPGRTFGIELAESDPTITVGLIPSGCGGSPISSWQPGGYWDQTKSHPYDDAIARARKAMKNGTLKVILWHQGEADCGAKNSALYFDRFKTLVERFRKDLGNDKLPVVVGQLSQFPGEKWPRGRHNVDAAQRKVVETMQPAAFAESTGFTSNPDRIHFDAASQRAFGKRYFEAYKKIAVPDGK